MKLPAAAFALVLGVACGGGSQRSNNAAAGQKFALDLDYGSLPAWLVQQEMDQPAESHYSNG